MASLNAHRLWPSVSRAARRIMGRELNQFAYNLQTLATPGAPEVFQVELTNHCPMTCVMCPRTNSMTRPLGYMDEALFRSVVDQISTSSSGIFLHHFGDSLLHPKLADCIRYASEKQVKTYLSANPALLTLERARGLVDSGLHELVLSLDGLSPDVSGAIRGPAARNVDLAEQRIRALLDYRKERGSKTPHLILQIVRQKQNRHEIARWLEKWRAVEGIDRIKVKTFVGWNGRDEKINALRVERRDNRKGVVCDKPWSSVTILWDGRVVPCCFDHDGLYVLGDLRQTSLRDIWNGEPMRRLRKAHRDDASAQIKLCERCTDKEGYRVKKWYYPLNRFFTSQSPLGDEDAERVREAGHAD